MLIKIFNRLKYSKYRKKQLYYQKEWSKRLNKVGIKLLGFTVPLMGFSSLELRLIILLVVFYCLMMEHEPFRQKMVKDLQTTEIIRLNKQTLLEFQVYVLGALFYWIVFMFTLYKVVFEA